jgi:hypothetical protein
MKQFLQILVRLAGTAALLTALGGSAQADLGLMLNGALRVGASKWTGAGHSSVYLSNVCMVSAVELRMCQPGENGVVLTNYRSFEEDRHYEWNAVPLNLYLYGVEDESQRALYASTSVRWMLQERYREKYLGARCTGRCASDPNALWREAVASSFIREIYMFTVKTTPEQDRAMVEKFNRAGNVDHFNGLTNNCADFAREIVNTYFPGAAKPDHINDFWITSPKAIAKSFAHYGAKRPELEFRVVRFTQIPGEYPQSTDNRKGDEVLFRANKWRLPLAVLQPYGLIAFAASYNITGRFNPELELRRHPAPEVVAWERSLREAKAQGNLSEEKECKQKIGSVRANSLGTEEEWSSYHASIRQYEAEALEQGYASDLDSLRKFSRQALSKSWVTMDANGGLWLNPRNEYPHPLIGMSANTLLQARSDSKLGYLLVLSRVDAELRRKPKNRETLEFFRRDWQLMERLRGQVISLSAGAHRPEPAGGAAQ